MLLSQFYRYWKYIAERLNNLSKAMHKMLPVSKTYCFILYQKQRLSSQDHSVHRIHSSAQLDLLKHMEQENITEI